MYPGNTDRLLRMIKIQNMGENSRVLREEQVSRCLEHMTHWFYRIPLSRNFGSVFMGPAVLPVAIERREKLVHHIRLGMDYSQDQPALKLVPFGILFKPGFSHPWLHRELV